MSSNAAKQCCTSITDEALRASNTDTDGRTNGLRTASPSRDNSPSVTRGRTYGNFPGSKADCGCGRCVWHPELKVWVP